MTATTPLDRERAVANIAAAIADRTAFVILGAPHMLDALGYRLKSVPDWTAYVDNGTPLALRTEDAATLRIVPTLVPATVVVTVPKTVPAAALDDALGPLGQHVPDDGSRDMLILHDGDDQPIVWPTLFVDALEQVDPRAAAQLRATDIAIQS
jgi:hypothetical protein